jgi:hypothetical protein
MVDMEYEQMADEQMADDTDETLTFITNDNVSFTENKKILKQSKFFNEIIKELESEESSMDSRGPSGRSCPVTGPFGAIEPGTGPGTGQDRPAGPLIINVSSQTMSLVLEFMDHQSPLRDPIKEPYSIMMQENVPEWYVMYTKDFFRTPETTKQMISLFYAADYLQIETLIDLIACKMSSVLKEKLVLGNGYDHCLEMFGLCPFTDFKKNEIYKVNPWTYLE